MVITYTSTRWQYMELIRLHFDNTEVWAHSKNIYQHYFDMAHFTVELLEFIA
jgi:hypothetical protein